MHSWVLQDTYLKIGKEDVRTKLQKRVLHPRNITCVELVYGLPGQLFGLAICLYYSVVVMVCGSHSTAESLQLAK